MAAPGMATAGLALLTELMDSDDGPGLVDRADGLLIAASDCGHVYVLTMSAALPMPLG